MESNEKNREQQFLLDFVNALLEDARLAQSHVIHSQGTPQEGFDVGVVQGYWQVLSSLVSRMKIHELDLSDYGLEGYDPDSVWSPIRENLSARNKTPGNPSE